MASTVPKSMQAQVLDAYKTPYKLQALETPLPVGPHEILIKVDAASYCHTDFVLAEGQMPGLPTSFPHIGCHEFAGTVVSHFGSPSDEAKALAAGTRVGVPGRSFHACGECFECRNDRPKDPVSEDERGYSVYCVDAENNGLSKHGGFAEYAVVDARQVAPIPDSLTSVETAPLMCAGVTIYAALKRCKLPKNARVGIMGAGGGLGHLGLQYGVYMGYRVLGIEAADGPMELAHSVRSRLDEEHRSRIQLVDARVEQAPDVVQKFGKEDSQVHTGAMGLDAVIMLPESQTAFDYAMALLKTHGTCVVVSFPEKGFNVSARDIVFRDIKVIGSLVGSNNIMREMLQFSARYGVQAISKCYSLARLTDLVEEYHKGGGGKLVVDMSLQDS